MASYSLFMNDTLCNVISSSVDTIVVISLLLCHSIRDLEGYIIPALAAMAPPWLHLKMASCMSISRTHQQKNVYIYFYILSISDVLQIQNFTGDRELMPIVG